MNKKIISKAMDYIDDEYIAEAMPKSTNKKPKVIPFKQIVAVAAAVVLVSTAVPILYNHSITQSPSISTTTTTPTKSSETVGAVEKSTDATQSTKATTKTKNETTEPAAEKATPIQNTTSAQPTEKQHSPSNQITADTQATEQDNYEADNTDEEQSNNNDMLVADSGLKSPSDNKSDKNTTYYNSLKTVNKKAGTNIHKVTLKNVDYEEYCVFNKTVGCYSFDYRDGTFIVRASKTYGDISYVNVGKKKISQLCTSNKIIRAKGTNTLDSKYVYFVKWYVGNTQYNLIGYNTNKANMTKLYKNIKN